MTATLPPAPALPPLGAPLPAFVLQDAQGAPFTPADLAGTRTVIFTYGQDGTPTCTSEIKEFDALLAAFTATGTRVFGLSKDKPATHAKFAAKAGLSVPLLSDAGGAVMESWGAFGPKIFFGKPVVGVLRKTFLLDESARLIALWEVARVKGHAADVLAALQSAP